MTGFDLSLALFNDVPGTFTVAVHDGLPTDPALWSADIANSTLPLGLGADWVHFDTGYIPLTPGQTYSLSVTSENFGVAVGRTQNRRISGACDLFKPDYSLGSAWQGGAEILSSCGTPVFDMPFRTYFEALHVAPWDPGNPTTGRCEILVWFDGASVIGDTDDAVDEWHVSGAARFYDFDTERDREVAATAITSFTGDAGAEITLEEQWRTESWEGFAGQVRLDDLSLVVRERDGRLGDDQGTMAVSPGLLIGCGDTVSMSVMVPVAPLASRGRAPVTDSPGLVEIHLTITAVPVAGWAR